MKDITPEVLLHIKELQDKVTKASDDYYNGIESMSNFEYDALYDELQKLEEEYDLDIRITAKVGAKINGEGVRHEHEAKSLDKTKDVNVLINEQRKTGFNPYVCLSWKLDGLTLCLSYENGKLKQALTRGDGKVGQDVTDKAQYIKGIPLTITYKEKLEVRGECLMPYAEFDRLNDEAGGIYANPRNLASGTIGSKDISLIKDRQLDFKAFQLVSGDICNNLASFSDRLDWLKSEGFDTVEHKKVILNDLERAIKDWSREDVIKGLGMPVDGLVIMHDYVDAVKDWLDTEHHPNTAKGMAFKWQDETVPTVLREIEWSPSRTGLLNPVAVFDTVQLCGTEVSRASLHNISYIKSLNLQVGDKISVYKANMIIPQIAENLDRMRHQLKDDDKQKTLDFSHIECPCCKQTAKIEVSADSGIETLVCGNEKCLAKELGRYTHFVEKQGMNIEGLSEKSLLFLMENGFIESLADIYALEDHPEIMNYPNYGEKSYKNLLSAIEKSRTTDMEHFLYACGIEGFGKGQSKVLVNYLKEHYDTDLKPYQYNDGSYDLMGLLVQMNHDGFDFTRIDGIGKVLAENLHTFLDKNFHVIDSLSDRYEMSDLECVLANLKFTDKPLEKVADNNLIKGKTFVITGSLETFKNREELVALIESNGGKVAGGVSSKTDYLINNDVTSSSAKNVKAKSLNIPIISEKDFIALTAPVEEKEAGDGMTDRERELEICHQSKTDDNSYAVAESSPKVMTYDEATSKMLEEEFERLPW